MNAKLPGRRTFAKQAAVGGLAGIFACGQAPAYARGRGVRWRLASSFPQTLDTIYGGAQVFAESLSKMSNGQFQVSVHAAGELVPAFGVFDAVSQGSLEAGATAGYYYFGKDDAIALDCAIPFGMNARQMNAWMFDGKGLTLLRQLFANYNIVNFPMGNTGAQMGGWYRKRIKSLNDVKGLKVRIAGFAGRVFSRLGGIPQNLPGGEIYQALEKGTIDGTEWVGPYDDLKLELYRIAKYYMYPAWWEGSAQLSLYVNRKAYEALPSSMRHMVAAASRIAHVDMQAKYDARNPRALKEIVGRGVSVVRMPKSVMDAAYQTSQELYAQLSKTNKNWRKIYADYAAFQKNQVAWFKYAERGFDSYMQSRV